MPISRYNCGTSSQSYQCHLPYGITYCVTCYQTQVNTAPLTLPDRPVLNLSTPRDERLSWPSWLVTYWDGLPIYSQSPIQVVTRTRHKTNAMTAKAGCQFNTVKVAIKIPVYELQLHSVNQILWTIAKMHTACPQTYRVGQNCNKTCRIIGDRAV